MPYRHLPQSQLPRQPRRMEYSPPLVVVEGFLSAASFLRDDGYRQHLGGRDVLIASIGPVSSLHDRACELFYGIKGGTVDYGEEHGRMFGHARYGRKIEEPLYPSWSPSRPLHFLGHSMGGSTIIKMQALMSQGFFGPFVHPDMCLSITTMSSPFRGTQVLFPLGVRPECAPAVRPWSLGVLITKSVHVLAYLAPILPSKFDMHAEARGLGFNKSSFLSFLKQLWWSEWGEGKDGGVFDLTFEASDTREAAGEGFCNPGTYYRSFVATVTERCDPSSDCDMSHTPTHMKRGGILQWLSKKLGTFDYSKLNPLPSFYPPIIRGVSEDPQKAPSARAMGEEYWANDAVVPVFSQWHPHPCAKTRCVHHNSDGLTPTVDYGHDVKQHKEYPHERIVPGVWNVYTIEGIHHLSILPRWFGTPRQKAFYISLHFFLREADGERIDYEEETVFLRQIDVTV